MSCGKGKITTKKKIAIFSSIGVGVIAVTYLLFITTNNPTISVTLPALLSLAACPAMCIGMGAIIGFKNLFSKNKNKKENENTDSKQEMSSTSYYDVDNDMGTNSKKQQELTKDAMISSTHEVEHKDITLR